MSKESDEKRELLKLKQGIISESEVIEQDVHEQPEKADCCQENRQLFSSAINGLLRQAHFFAAVGFFLVYQAVTREQPDLTVILAVSDTSKAPGLYQKINDIELALEKYCPDFDGNGYVHVAVYSIDLTKSGNMQYIQSNTAKFYGEIERGVAELYICDADLLTGETSTEDYDPDDNTIALTYENMFSDIGKALEMPEYNGKLRIDLKDTGFVYDAKWEKFLP